MTTLTIRDVPENQVNVIKRRAEREGQSMESYLRKFIERETACMTPAEWAEELRKNPPVKSPVTHEDVMEAIDQGRQERDRREADRLADWEERR